MVKGKKLLFFFCLCCIVLLNAGFASAAALEINYPSIFGKSLNDSSTLSSYVCYLFGLITYLAIFITVIVIAFGGVYYLVSYGRGKFTSEAKDWIKAGIMGLLITICAALIMYTINPNLNTCSLGFLPFNIFGPSGISPLPPNVDVTTFKEIPIGTLTENLLTRTMDCYGFDQDGNPVDGDNGPTYINHDIEDCLAQLVDGAQKKNRAISALSDEITKLMDKCKCSGDKCKADAGCEAPTTNCPSNNGQCNPPDPPSCSQSEDTKDCCPEVATDSKGNPILDFNGNQISVKDQIEHGPIIVSIKLGDITGSGSCSANIAVQNLTVSCSAEPKATDVGQPVTFISNVAGGTGFYSYSWTGDCKGSSETCSESFPFRGTKTANLKVISGDQSRSASCSTRITAEPDLTVSCYAQPGSTGINQNVDFISEILGGVSPYAYSWTGACTGSDVNCSKSFDTRGVKTANLTVSPDIECSSDGDCPNNETCDPSTSKCVCSSDSNCPNDEICDPTTSKCDCRTKPVTYPGLDEFRCPNPLDTSTPCENIPDFVEETKEINGKMVTVINHEKWNKLNLIQQLTYFKEKADRWVPDSKIQGDIDELNKARSALGSCYLAIPYIDLLKTYQAADIKSHVILKDPEEFHDPGTGNTVNVDRYCQGFNYAGDYTDSTCLNRCNDACPDASYNAIQYYLSCSSCEGNPDPNCQTEQEKCMETASLSRPCLYNADNNNLNFGGCIVSCQDDCINNCQKRYFKCSDEYKSCKKQCENSCVLDNSDKCTFGAQKFIDCANQLTNQGATQLTDQGNSNYCINRAYLCKNGSDNDINNPYCTGECLGRLNCPQCPCTNAGTQCSEYSYNDDPLTFYCEDNWLYNPYRDAINAGPIGNDRVVELEKEGEIPVGQTVDDAENWAVGLIKTEKQISEEIQKTIDLMTKIGKAETTYPVRDYCKCNAKFETGDAICKGDCKYKQENVCNPDDPSDCSWNCQCEYEPCKGNPCQQISDYLSKIKTDYTKPSDSRSSIIKELIYSRKTMNDCSLTGNNYGLLQARVLSCTRVEDEIIPPIDTYCYGTRLGNLYNKSLTDDWYCTKQYSEKPKPSNNPLYNK